MASWRVLELSEQPDKEQIPQLLVKPIFSKNSYTVFLTDLGDIWSEELSLEGLIDRASSQQSPIEVSKQDTSQLAILLQNVESSLRKTESTTCQITRGENDSLRLHTTIRLPEPLDSLAWTFNLEKRDALMLKDELLLPLLVASYTQHERIRSLITIIHDKDRAITRFMDQYESGNLDLTAAFPSAAQSGRKIVKREQAAKHVPALQPFREEIWKQGFDGFDETQLTSLNSLEDSLAQGIWRVPPRLRSQPRESAWWSVISTKLVHPNRIPKRRTPKQEVKPSLPSESDDETETEDEFETHENFNTRKSRRDAPENIVSPDVPTPGNMEGQDGADSTEDEDLDAHPKQQTQREEQPPITLESDMPQPDKKQVPAGKPKGTGFRIGGKKKVASPLTDTTSPSQNAVGFVEDDRDVKEDSHTQKKDLEPDHAPKGRRPFTIGGKSKKANNKVDADTVPSSTGQGFTQPQDDRPPPTPFPPPMREVKHEEPVDEPPEGETAEEKAERRRKELKRKSEDAARKQAQQKKKKRF